MYKKKKEIIDSLKVNSKDVGSSEVQIGLLSEKINHLGDHFKKNKNDKHSTMGLLRAVNQRKRLLKYLKKNNSESYKNILSKLNLRK
jgi:small subunit ribosomal protein S15